MKKPIVHNSKTRAICERRSRPPRHNLAKACTHLKIQKQIQKGRYQPQVTQINEKHTHGVNPKGYRADKSTARFQNQCQRLLYENQHLTIKMFCFWPISKAERTYSWRTMLCGQLDSIMPAHSNKTSRVNEGM